MNDVEYHMHILVGGVVIHACIDTFINMMMLAFVQIELDQKFFHQALNMVLVIGRSTLERERNLEEGVVKVLKKTTSLERTVAVASSWIHPLYSTIAIHTKKTFSFAFSAFSTHSFYSQYNSTLKKRKLFDWI